MIIREASTADFPAVMTLYSQLHPNEELTLENKEQEAFNEILSDHRLKLFVLEQDREIVATCYLNVIPNITRSASPYGIIENVVTDQKYRSRGLGKEIIAHALTNAWSLGCYKVMLQTGSARKNTREFYTSCGFSGDDKHAFVAWQPRGRKNAGH